jgi:hypothetical protein
MGLSRGIVIARSGSMRRWRMIALLLVVAGLVGIRSARAEEVVVRSPDQRSLLMTVGGGLCVPKSGQLFSGYATELAFGYLEANFQIDLRRYLGVSAFAAAAPCVGGGMLGGTARFAQPWDESSVRLTAGLGPSFGSGGEILAEADVSLEIRSQIGFAMVVGPKIAVALNHAGDPKCGVDTCDVNVPPGSYLFLVRLGFGFNL